MGEEKEPVPLWRSPERLVRRFQEISRASRGKLTVVEGEHDLDKRLLQLHLSVAERSPRLYLSSGIHGDEPAGPMALLKMFSQEEFFRGVEVFAFPILNPSGLRAGTRENERGVDLNRNFGPAFSEDMDTERHIAAIGKCSRMDVSLCLHEDWEAGGVYLYHVESGARRFDAESVLHAMETDLPRESSCVIDGSQASNGIIYREESDYLRDDWPESIYLVRKLTRASFTLETPSSASLNQRVAAHCAGVSEVVSQLRKRAAE